MGWWAGRNSSEGRRGGEESEMYSSAKPMYPLYLAVQRALRHPGTDINTLPSLLGGDVQP
jgi:hypothetical protein